MSKDRSARYHLQSALQHKDWRTRRNILSILPENIVTNGDGVSLIQDVWNNYNSEESGFARAAVIRALGAIVGTDSQLYHLIASHLRDEDWHVRCAAIDALAPLLPKSADARRHVVSHLYDSDEDVRVTAVKAL